MAFFESTRIRWAFEDWLEQLNRRDPSREYSFDEGNVYRKVWWRYRNSSDPTRSAVGFVDPRGNLYRADSWKKRGRLMLNVQEIAARHAGLSAKRDPAKRKRSAPAFRVGEIVHARYSTRVPSGAYVRQGERGAVEEIMRFANRGGGYRYRVRFMNELGWYDAEALTAEAPDRDRAAARRRLRRGPRKRG